MVANGGGDRVHGSPEGRALPGAGLEESAGGEFPPLGASDRNPADHPIAPDRGLANLGVQHSYDGPAWFEGEDRAVHGQNIHRVHCAVPRCGADVRNIAVARKNHIMMHVRAAARLTGARGDAPVATHSSPVTQVDVARRAGLDVSSANKILNGDVGPKFSDKTRDRVLRIARKLGYRFPPRGKRVKAMAARALIDAAKAFLGDVQPGDGDRLAAAIAAAEQIWPAPPQPTCGRDGKVVGA